MRPALRPGQLVLIAAGRPKPGDVVVFDSREDGIEKIKRVRRLSGKRLYVVGDNAERSTDSRQFGWINAADVTGRVIWPRCSVAAARKHKIS